MDKAHLSSLLSTAGAVEGKDGFWEVPEGKSVTLYVANSGASLTVARVTALRSDGGLLHARTAKGETYVLAAEDVYAGAVEGGAAPTARRAGFV